MERTQVEFSVLQFKAAQASSGAAFAERSARFGLFDVEAETIDFKDLLVDAYDHEAVAGLVAELMGCDSKAALGRIGKRLGKRSGTRKRLRQRLKPAKFDPDADDADSDGLVQEGTVHERPAPPKPGREAVGRALNRAADAVDARAERRESRRAERKPGRVRQAIGGAALALADRIDGDREGGRRRNEDRGNAPQGVAAAEDVARVARGDGQPGRQFGAVFGNEKAALFEANALSQRSQGNDFFVIKDDEGKFRVVDKDRFEALGRPAVGAFRDGAAFDAPTPKRAPAAVRPRQPRQPGRQFGGAFQREDGAERAAQRLAQQNPGEEFNIIKDDDGKFRVVDNARLGDREPVRKVSVPAAESAAPEAAAGVLREPDERADEALRLLQQEALRRQDAWNRQRALLDDSDEVVGPLDAPPPVARPDAPNIDGVFWDDENNKYVDADGNAFGIDELDARGIDWDMRFTGPLSNVPPFVRNRPATPKPDPKEAAKNKREEAQRKRLEQERGRERQAFVDKIEKAVREGNEDDLRLLNRDLRRLAGEASRKFRDRRLTQINKDHHRERMRMLDGLRNDGARALADLEMRDANVRFADKLDRSFERHLARVDDQMKVLERANPNFDPGETGWDNPVNGEILRNKAAFLDEELGRLTSILGRRYIDPFDKALSERQLEHLAELRNGMAGDLSRWDALDGRSGQAKAIADDMTSFIREVRADQRKGIDVDKRIDAKINMGKGMLQALESRLEELRQERPADDAPKLDRDTYLDALAIQEGVIRAKKKSLEMFEEERNRAARVKEALERGENAFGANLLPGLGLEPQAVNPQRGLIAEFDMDGIPGPKAIENPNIKTVADAVAFVRSGGSLNEVPNEFWLEAVRQNSDQYEERNGVPKRDQNGNLVWTNKSDQNRFVRIPKNGGAVGLTEIYLIKDESGNPTQQGWVIKGSGPRDALGEIVGYNFAAAHGVIPEGAGWDGEDQGRIFAVVPHAFNEFSEGDAPVYFPSRGNYDPSAVFGNADWAGPNGEPVDAIQAQQAYLAHFLHNYLMAVGDRHHGNGITVVRDGKLYVFPIDQGWMADGGWNDITAGGWMDPKQSPQKYLSRNFGMHPSLFDDIRTYQRSLMPEAREQHRRAIAEIVDGMIERAEKIANMSDREWEDKFLNGARVDIPRLKNEVLPHYRDFYRSRVQRLKQERDAIIKEMVLQPPAPSASGRAMYPDGAVG